MVITKVRNCVGGQVMISSNLVIMTNDQLLILSSGWLVSGPPGVSPVLLLAAPGLGVNIHKVGAGGDLYHL